MALWLVGENASEGMCSARPGVTRRQVKGKVRSSQQKGNCDTKRCRTFKTSLFKGLQFKPRLQKRFVVLIGIVLLICVGAGIVHLCYHLSQGDVRNGEGPPDPDVPQPPSPSKERVFSKAAVCSDGAPCSTVGREILERNGSAVDAAIATMLCNGVVNGHSMGIGGGFLMTFYHRAERKAYSLNARERAPLKASPDMFQENPKSSKRGALAIGVPGELKGYWEAHRRFGRLPWADLVTPAVKICEQGYNMTKHQADALTMSDKAIRDDKNLMDTFFDPESGKYKKAGTLIKQTKLCTTLRLIAERGADDFYMGSIAKMLVHDIQTMGGIITEKDFSSYNAIWSEPFTTSLRDGEVLYTSPAPGSGPILGFVLNILNGYNFTASSVASIDDMVRTYHRIAESFKYAFAKRTQLGDGDFLDNSKLLSILSSKEYAENIRSKIQDNGTNQDPNFYGAVIFNQEDHGTAHISIIDQSGDAVAITSTVNLYFGAGITSKQTGIILNSVMDDFSSRDIVNHFGLPGSPANAIAPGKRPLSSMCPTVIVGPSGEVRMVVGASGGTKIISAVAYVIMRHLWFGESIKQAVDASRFHHQLFPMEIEYEYGVLAQVVKGLEKLGHKMKRYRDRGSIICAVTKKGNEIIANADYRKGGEVDGM